MSPGLAECKSRVVGTLGALKGGALRSLLSNAQHAKIRTSLRCACSLSLLWLAGQAEAAPTSLTLPDALAYAHQHQPELRRMRAEIAARLAEAKVPRALWLPRIGATAQLLVGTANNTSASVLNVRETDLPRIGGTKTSAHTDWRPAPSTLAALSLQQEVYDFGRIAALAAVGDAEVATARAAAASVLLDLDLAVEETFAAVLGAKEVARATEEAYRRALAHRDYAEAATKSGLRAPIELVRAQADVAQLEVRRLQAAAALDTARAALAAAIGSREVGIDALDANDPSNRDSSALATSSPTLDEALRQAASDNPAIALALSRVTAQQQRRRAIGYELAPNLFATGSLSGRAGGVAPSAGEVPLGRGWLPAVGNWDVGLVLQWNLFDATVLARRTAAAAREEAALAELEVVRTQVALGAQRAVLELSAAERALPGLAAALRAARANHAQAEARYAAGLGTTLELADSEALLTNAELGLAIGKFAVRRARAVLARSLGKGSAESPQSVHSLGSKR